MPYKEWSKEDRERIEAEIRRVEMEISVKTNYLESVKKSLVTGQWYSEDIIKRLSPDINPE